MTKVKYDDSSPSLCLSLTLVRRLNAARRYDIFCKCREGSVWGGMLQDGPACTGRAAPLCCKTPFLPLVAEAVTGIFLTTLAFHPSQSGVFVSRRRKEVISGSTEPTCPTGHLKDILKEWHSGQAGQPFIYPADPACRPYHIASSSLLALPLRRSGSSKQQQRVEILGYPDVFTPASLLRPGPKQAPGLNSQQRLFTANLVPQRWPF